MFYGSMKMLCSYRLVHCICTMGIRSEISLVERFTLTLQCLATQISQVNYYYTKNNVRDGKRGMFTPCSTSYKYLYVPISNYVIVALMITCII